MSLVKKNEGFAPSFRNMLSDFWEGDKFFDAGWLKHLQVPAVNIKDRDGIYDIEMAAPGLEKKDFKISLDHGMLTISSEKTSENADGKQGGYTRKEFNYSSFSRSFMLPSNVDDQSIKASYVDGILRIEVAKMKPASLEQKKAIVVE